MANEISENIFLVNAPAGSGKTTKIRQMVESHLRKYPDDNILCITYTNRAAEELGKDIDSDNVFFGTIHSFINHFIGSFFSHRAVIDLYWEIYKDKILERIENIENKENVADGNRRYIEKYGRLDLKTVYTNIQEITYNEAPYNSLYRGALSHDDLITFTRIIVDKFPVIKRKIADKYQLIFIDEYQDTSADVLFIFYESMKNENGKMYLLGDKMQQIYKTYDGSFEKEFSMLNQSIKLSINYRTTPKIVSILNYIYNDEVYEQIPFQKNQDESMQFPPEIVITSLPEKALEKIKQKDSDVLVLYLLNKSRFYSIGAGELYDSVGKMDKYGFGKKNGVIDVLTISDNSNPDNLFLLLFLFGEIVDNYRNKLYGKVFRLIKENKKILNVSKCTIRKHSDKKILKELLDDVVSHYEKGEESIRKFLAYLKEIKIVKWEYIDEIIGEEDYLDVLEVPIQEFHNLVVYLQNPQISTQHGVKGESHDSVVFMVANSNHEPFVNMTKFFELWSKVEVSLSEFEAFYYEYKQLIQEVELALGMKSSKLKSDIYEENKEKIQKCIYNYAAKNSRNLYFVHLLQPVFDKYIAKPLVTNARECLKESLVYAPLSAYKLFYVGCSRARKNLSIIIDGKDIKGFEDDLIDKFVKCGFKVIKDGIR